ncbi:hypothetical protein CTI14_68765, partial [Methylobacterium radiotolerans]
GLSDELGLREHGVGGDRLQKRMVRGVGVCAVAGKLPVCQPPRPTSQGSAMSLVSASTGSAAIACRSGWSGV